MSIVITGQYRGSKRCELTHQPTGTKIITDAPKDNHGEGTTFSPTDLMAASLGSCVLTTVAIVAERDGVDLSGSHFEVTKVMNDQPRRIRALPVVFHMPKALSTEQRGKYERVAKNCPVHHSISPEIEAEIQFIYDV